MGNYVQGNEPGHHIPYLYNWTGKEYKTQERVRIIMEKMYGPKQDGLCGNDDAGQMSAWYIFSALGFYPVVPGSPNYALGSPLMEEAVLHLDNGNSVKIVAKNQSAKNIYVQRVSIDGKKLNRNYLTHDEITKSKEIVFEMSSKPKK
jgi:predicted alpha-1,2-mannosidase